MEFTTKEELVSYLKSLEQRLESAEQVISSQNEEPETDESKEEKEPEEKQEQPTEEEVDEIDKLLNAK